MPYLSLGQEWRDSYVNQGWLALACHHCGKKFYTKISIPTIDVQVQLEDPEAPVGPAFK